MSRSSSSKTSQTAWPRIKALKEKDIALPDGHPATEVKHIVRGIVEKGDRQIILTGIQGSVSLTSPLPRIAVLPSGCGFD